MDALVKSNDPSKKLCDSNLILQSMNGMDVAADTVKQCQLKEAVTKTHDAKVKPNKVKNPYEDIVAKHSLLVKRIARHLSAKMPSNVQVDDLIQAGMIGLLEAAKKYDVSKGASFETFAGIRIRGAMLDEIRRGDWGPRSVYRNSRKINEFTRIIEAKLGRDAKDSEIANAMGISFSEYSTIMKDLKGCRLFSLDEVVGPDEPKVKKGDINSIPDLNFADERFKTALLKAIETLSEREQLVLKLYYEQELNLKEIGSQLGVSESRVSQIHSQAALRLRGKLNLWNENVH